MIHYFEPTYHDLITSPIGMWVTVLTTRGVYLHIRGTACVIAIEEEEPTNCNRGPFHAKLEILDLEVINIERNDGWDYGRYYFDLDRAKAEVECWLKAWGQIG